MLDSLMYLCIIPNAGIIAKQNKRNIIYKYQLILACSVFATLSCRSNLYFWSPSPCIHLPSYWIFWIQWNVYQLTM